ncbi:MAG: hypothetical protein WCQ77_01985 [Planctomycetota bacterium]
MTNRFIVASGLAFAACVAIQLVIPRQAHAEESLPALSRKIFAQYKDSVVKVTGVATVRLTAANRPGLNLPEREDKVRADGTIVDASGLTVLSLSAIDPSRMVDGREANTPGGAIKVEASATIKELEIILGDGTEIPATLVFKDTELDLAFVRPKADAPEANGVTFVPVNLAAGGRAEVADYTVTVARLDELFNYDPALTPGQIWAVVERPRPFYLGGGIVRGCPMFLLDGKLLGIGIMKLSKTRGQSQAIVPADEVAKLIPQIPTDTGEK